MDRVRDLVATGSVDLVLAQNRNRFSREPAYTYLLAREFEEYGCMLHALNDRGDGSPEGELTNGILDQLAKFERAKTGERTRRGKLRRAREGKIVPTHTPDYGFEFNTVRDNYVVNEAQMAVVRRIFRMIGAEGLTMHAVKKTFEREGVSAPGGGTRWDRTFFRSCVLDDVYKPHTFQEVQELVAPGVVARLDPTASYGIWWFNRRRRRRTRVSDNGPNGRSYRWQYATVIRPREEWIAVPVPDPGIPREWVDAAREAIKDNHPLVQWATVRGTLGTYPLLQCLRTPDGDCSRARRWRTLEEVLLLSLPFPEQRGSRRLPAGKELPGRSTGGASMGGSLRYLQRPQKAPR
jgi:site-specific DNA recombinase